MDDLDDSALLARKDDALQRQMQIEDFRALLATPYGSNVLRRIIARCGIFRLSYDAMSERETCRKEGERNIGLWLVHELETVDPGTFAKLSCNSEHLDNKKT